MFILNVLISLMPDYDLLTLCAPCALQFVYASCERYQEAATGGGSNPRQPPRSSQDGSRVHLCTAWRE